MCVPAVVVVASHNPAKVAELRRLLEGWGVAQIRGISEFPEVSAPAEDGTTYAENARTKAVSAAAATGLPAVGDDSGLEVDALRGRPGIRSARYGGGGLSNADRVAKLLAELEAVPEERRGARFLAVAVLAWPDGRTVEAPGECRGRIAVAPVGAAGFGYDPVFVYPEIGRTFAEISAADKDRVDHRGHAMRALRDAVLAACPGVGG